MARHTSKDVRLEAERRIEQLAFDIYDDVYGHLDDKRHKSRFITEIIDWLINGDLEGRSLEDLAEEWREYTTTAEEDTMNESEWYRMWRDEN